MFEWINWFLRFIRCLWMTIRRLLGLPPFAGHSPCAPDYDPAPWNDCPNPVPLGPPQAPVPSSYCLHGNHTQGRNNCYNYGCNLQTDTFAQPGRAHGSTAATMSCPDVAQAAEKDGLKPVHRCDRCPHCCHKVALVIWPGTDYHWYRQDSSGRWSHKPDKGMATDRDSSGKVINDPETADRGPYTVFCGYFCVCAGQVQIQ